MVGWLVVYFDHGYSLNNHVSHLWTVFKVLNEETSLCKVRKLLLCNCQNFTQSWLVLYVQMQWWICWSPFNSLPYCFIFVVHDFGFVSSFMGDTKICCWALSLLGRSFWLSSKWSYLDGYPPWFDVVHLEGKAYLEFWRHRNFYA